MYPVTENAIRTAGQLHTEIIAHDLCPPVIRELGSLTPDWLVTDRAVATVECYIAAVDAGDFIGSGLVENATRWHAVRTSLGYWKAAWRGRYGGIEHEISSTPDSLFALAVLDLALRQLRWQHRQRLAKLNLPDDLSAACAEAAKLVGAHHVQLDVQIGAAGVVASILTESSSRVVVLVGEDAKAPWQGVMHRHLCEWVLCRLAQQRAKGEVAGG